MWNVSRLTLFACCLLTLSSCSTMRVAPEADEPVVINCRIDAFLPAEPLPLTDGKLDTFAVQDPVISKLRHTEVIRRCALIDCILSLEEYGIVDLPIAIEPCEDLP